MFFIWYMSNKLNLKAQQQLQDQDLESMNSILLVNPDFEKKLVLQKSSSIRLNLKEKYQSLPP